MEIKFGEGGNDSKLFVDDMLEMYVRWAEINNLKYELLHKANGKAALRIKGKKAWNCFKNESGKHCVQRIPPTESKGRRHTSFISVAVLPIRKDRNFVLKDNDVDIKTQGGHGKGGQHQNVTDSAVRATHKETGLKVFINGRDQHYNRRLAMEVLASKVENHYEELEQAKRNSLRKEQVAGGSRSGKIRTYNFIDNRVVDHRLNTKTSKIKQVMRGKLGLILKE